MTIKNTRWLPHIAFLTRRNVCSTTSRRFERPCLGQRPNSSAQLRTWAHFSSYTNLSQRYRLGFFAASGTFAALGLLVEQQSNSPTKEQTKQHQIYIQARDTAKSPKGRDDDHDTKAGTKQYRLDEIKAHDSPEHGVWVVHDTDVLDISAFYQGHPGGEVILRAAGKSVDPYHFIQGL